MKRTFFSPVLLVVLILISCNSEKTEVRLAASKNLWNSLALIAIDQKFFEAEGLNVTVSYLDAGRFCMDAVLSNSADFGNVVDVNVAYLGYSPNNTVTLVNELSGCLASDIVARKSRGINVPTDLKGKSLAFSPGTTSDVFARRFLAKYGIREDTVKLVKIQPKGMVPGMTASDGPDAASTWEPFVSSMRKGLGEDVVVFEAPEIYTAREFTAVRTEWAREHRETVLAYLRALKKANEFVINHKEQAQQIVAKMTGLDLPVVKSSWEPYQITFAYDKGKYLKEITQIGQEISNLPDYKGQKVPDYAPFVDDTYFNAVK